ncbi:MAG: rhodanese-like domain-containing protein [Thermoanaerobaculia bacterium]|nr:rhodanese-like domain-containing protein [Thermoanaerobaculia bacterium]
MRASSSPRLAVALACAALVASLGCAGEPARNLTEAEKRQRIEAMYAEYRDEFPRVEAIGPAELAAELAAETGGDEGLVVVDARSDEERAVSTIPGAIPRQEFERRSDDLAGHDVVTYCTIGYRSGLYAQELVERGFRARNLAGSILAWTHEGLPLVTPEGEPTRRVHVYGERWNLAAEGYEAVW